MEKILNTIIHGECIEQMKNLPDKSINLIIVDPPYNLQLNNDLIRPNDGTIFDGVDDTWDIFSSLSTYDIFTKEYLYECRRVLHDDGTIMVMGMYHNIFRVGAIMQNMGYWILNDIIWQKNNPTPNFQGKRLCNSHETIIWAAKSEKSKYFFNYHFMKNFNNGKQMRSDWLMPICSGKERVLQSNGEKAHSTQKPLSLMQRMVLMASKVNDVVLDPMCGTSTTLVAAKMYNRNYIGIERSADYVKLGEKRLQETTIDEAMLKIESAVQIKSKPIRVAFEKIVTDGKLDAGAILEFYKTPKKPLGIQAIVSDNGLVEYNGEHMSIHAAARLVLNKISANGWKYWYYLKDTSLECIDNIRLEYAKEQINV